MFSYPASFCFFLFLEKILVGLGRQPPAFSMNNGGKWNAREVGRTVKYFDREEHHFTSFRSILPFTPYPIPFSAKIPKYRGVTQDRQVPDGTGAAEPRRARDGDP